MLTTHSHKEVTYYFPVETAQWLLLRGQPIPVDLQEELQERGIVVEEFVERVTKETQKTQSGFSYFTL